LGQNPEVRSERSLRRASIFFSIAAASSGTAELNGAFSAPSFFLPAARFANMMRSDLDELDVVEINPLFIRRSLAIILAGINSEMINPLQTQTAAAKIKIMTMTKGLHQAAGNLSGNCCYQENTNYFSSVLTYQILNKVQAPSSIIQQKENDLSA
jgi:hypothetical protein